MTRSEDFISMTEIDLVCIAHVKVELIPVLKIYTIPIIGRFVWTTNFVQCGDQVYVLYFAID